MDAAAAYTCTYRVLLLNSHLQQKLRLIILVNLIQIINVNLWILVPFNFPHFMYISHLVHFCDMYGFEEWMDKFYGLWLFSFCQVAVNSRDYTFFVEYYWRSEYLIQFRLESEVVGSFLIPTWINLRGWWTVVQVNWISILHPTITKISMHFMNSPNKPKKWS